MPSMRCTIAHRRFGNQSSLTRELGSVPQIFSEKDLARIVKARYFSKKAEQKIKEAGGACILTA